MRVMTAPEGQQWREIANVEWPEGISEAQAVKEEQMRNPLRTLSQMLPA